MQPTTHGRYDSFINEIFCVYSYGTPFTQLLPFFSALSSSSVGALCLLKLSNSSSQRAHGSGSFIFFFSLFPSPPSPPFYVYCTFRECRALIYSFSSGSSEPVTHFLAIAALKSKRKQKKQKTPVLLLDRSINLASLFFFFFFFFIYSFFFFLLYMSKGENKENE